MMSPYDDDYVSRSEVQEMIDDAIRKHNRNAGIISMCVGWVVLALFAEGLLRLIGVIDPLFPWLKITLQRQMTEEDYQKLQEKVRELKMKYLFEEPCPLYEEVEDELD